MYINGGITVNSGVKMGNVAISAPIEMLTTFTSTTTWSLPSNAQLLNASMVLIGAGGGGGYSDYLNSPYHVGGGGGAGQVLYVDNLVANITPGTSYTITVAGAAAQGRAGNSSSAFGYTATGGGFGGWGGGLAPSTGSSGGGGASVPGSQTGAGGTSGKGFAGGNGSYTGGNRTGGGGGGAGGAGGVGSPTTGGAGVVVTIRGTSEVFGIGGYGAYNTSNGYVPSTVDYGHGGAGIAGYNGAGYGASVQGVCILKYAYILR